MFPASCESCSTALATDEPAISKRLIATTEIRLSEIISALSVALDITQGQPQGHCMRTALIGMHLADVLQLSSSDRSALFYAMLLKDLGCSSNAAKISYLFGADDFRVKNSHRITDWTKLGKSLKNCWRQCAPDGAFLERLMKFGSVLRLGEEGGRKISQVRCDRGANIARMLKLPEATARAIFELDEHWDGHGMPSGLAGENISLLGRICCLAQTVEVYFSTYGQAAAFDVARERRGKWFDPQLVDIFLGFHGDSPLWKSIQQADLMRELAPWEPTDTVLWTDEAGLDRVAEAFATVVDAKSPWTYQHSTRVAEIAVGVAEQFGCSPDVLRDIRRASLLHDIGKLGVSNLILDKPSKPTEEEFAQIRLHPEFSLRILQQVPAFAELADVASAHHERLDGHGYHRRLSEDGVPWIGRVLMVADIAEALTAQRPYRDALPWEKVSEIMTADAGKGVDHECLAALKVWWDRAQLKSRIEEQLREVDRLVAEL
jgi:putative nucleotidyltransferase with HDIG domain